MNPHILIIDDDDRIRDLLSKYLSKNNFITSSASSAVDAYVIMNKYIFDLLIVDYMMPEESGVEFIMKIRESPLEMVPIVMLTALSEVENRIEGLSVGADDYLSKPFEPKELVLRINNILKRTKSVINSNEVNFGDYKFSFDRKVLMKNNENIKLTEMEADILTILLKNVNVTLSREEIRSFYNNINERTIDVQITRIRKKIEDDIKNPRFLKTVRNGGYVFVL